MKIKKPLYLVASILLSQSAGLIGSLFTFDAIPTWYVTLNKPVFSPPNWLFAPVWTTLYTLIGISFYLLWISPKTKEKVFLVKFFLFHLFLNAIWSIIFFGMKLPSLAFFEIVIMWLTLVYLIKSLKKVSKVASFILFPYLLWISFASILNLAIWILN